MPKLHKTQQKSNFPPLTNHLNEAELKEYQPFVELFKIYSPYECYRAISYAIMFIPDYRDNEDWIVTIDVLNAHEVCQNLLEIHGIVTGWEVKFRKDLRANFKQLCGDSINLNYPFIHTLGKAMLGLIKFQEGGVAMEAHTARVLFAVRDAYLKIFALHNGIDFSKYES